MDAYQPPNSDLTIDNKRPFKPVKAVLYGLSIAFFLTTIVSTIVFVVLGIISGVDVGNEDALNTLFASNPLFLFIDIALTGVILYFAGSVVGKHTRGKEIKYAIIVSALLLIIITPLFVLTESFSTYPMWYNLSSFIIIPVGIYFGAKSKI